MKNHPPSALLLAAVCGALALDRTAGAQPIPFERDKPLVPLPHPGLKPDSMFGSSVGRVPEQDSLSPANRGAKWLRGGPIGAAQAAELGIEQFPIAGFWNLPAADSMNPASPYGAPKPEFVDREVRKQLAILQAHPEITAVEFYNEHWWMYNGASMAR